MLSNSHRATIIIFYEVFLFSVVSEILYYYLLVMPLSLSLTLLLAFLLAIFLHLWTLLIMAVKTLLNSKVTAELISGFTQTHTFNHAPSLSDLHITHLCYLISNLLHLNFRNIMTLAKMNGNSLCTIIFSRNGLFI